MKKTEPKKTTFARPTPPARWVPAGVSGWIDTIDPAYEKANAAGLARLCEILNAAKPDALIAASGAASEILEIMCDLTAGTNAHNAIQVLRPLSKALAADLIPDDTGRHKGGDTTHANKEARKNAIRIPVNEILNDPKKDRWNKDPKKITDHLVKNMVCGEVKKRTLRTYVEEIMAETAHPKPNL